MLRESVQSEGRQLDVADVTRGFGEDAGIPHAAALAAFTEAVVLRDTARTGSGRRALRDALGEAGLVDACAVAAAFHGFVRIADAIGIPHYSAPGGGDLSGLRERAGINDFYRVQEDGALR